MPRSRLAYAMVLAGVALVIAAAVIAIWSSSSSRGVAPGTAAPSVYAVGVASDPIAAGEVEIHESDAEGFVLLVESVPAGAAVSVDGQAKGETPASMNLECKTDAPLRVRISRAGFAPLEKTLPCHADKMVQLRARLRPAR